MNGPQQPAVFYVSVDGESTKGPYVMEQLKSMWDSGVLNVHSLFWHDEAQEWRPLLALLAKPSKPALPPHPLPHRAPPSPQPAPAVGSRQYPPAQTTPWPPPAIHGPPSRPVPPSPRPASAAPDIAGHDAAPRPWSRLWARYLDLQLFGLLGFWIGQVLFGPNSNARSGAVFATWMVGEGLFLTGCGTTIGKCMLGLGVVDLEGQKLTASVASRRFSSVFWRCIPILLPFCGLLAYRDLQQTGSTKWDKRWGCRVVARPRNAFLVLVAIVLIAFFIVVNIVTLRELFKDEPPKTALDTLHVPIMVPRTAVPLPPRYLRAPPQLSPAARPNQNDTRPRPAAGPASPPQVSRVLYSGGKAPFTTGPGTLNVVNRTAQNVIFKMIDLNQSVKACSFVVLAHSAYQVARIPDSRYLIAYSFGNNIVEGEDHFADATIALQFVNVIPYITVQTTNGPKPTREQVTLRTTEANAATGAMSVDDFNRM